MTKDQVFHRASQEVQQKAQAISGTTALEEARKGYDRGLGYLFALYDADVFDQETMEAGADLLKAAYREAEKKTAPGATNTESGSKKNSYHNFSVDEKTPDVKTGGATEFACACTFATDGIEYDLKLEVLSLVPNGADSISLRAKHREGSM